MACLLLYMIISIISYPDIAIFIIFRISKNKSKLKHIYPKQSNNHKQQKIISATKTTKHIYRKLFLWSSNIEFSYSSVHPPISQYSADRFC